MKYIYNIRLRLLQGYTHLRYTPILGIAALIGLLRIGIYAHLLNVGEFGLLSKLLLISSFFCVAGSLGFQLLAQRDVPAVYAIGRYRKGIIILGRAGIVTSAVAIITCLIPMFGLSPLSVPAFPFLLAIIHGWSQQLFMLIVIDSRSRLEMIRYSWQILARTILSSGAAIIVALMGGGALSIVAAEMLTTFLMTARMLDHLLHATRLSISTFAALSKNSFNKKEWHVSAVLLGGGILSFLTISADRWLAADRLSSEEFGLYSFAWIPMLMALSVQALLNAGFFPLLARRRVVKSDANVLHLTAIASGGLLLFSLFIAFVSNIIAAWAIPKWYPQYANTLFLFPPLLLAAAFRVSDFWSSYLIIMNRHIILLATQFFIVLPPILYYFNCLAGSSKMQNPYNFTLLALFLASGNYFINAIISIISGMRSQTNINPK